MQSQREQRPVWTEEKMRKAQQNHYYIKVGPQGGTLTLSGAKSRWSKPEHAGDVYVPSLRIVGTPNAIRALFPGDNRIEEHLAQAYSKSNHTTTMKNQYEREIAAHEQYRKAKKSQPSPGSSLLARLDYFVENLSKATEVAKAVSPRRSGARSPRQGKPLIERIRSLKPDRVLNVSKLDPATLKDARAIKKPKNPARSKFKGVDGFPMVADTPEHFFQAVRLLPPDNQYLIEAYRRQHGGSGASVPVAQTAPIGSPLGSPLAGRRY